MKFRSQHAGIADRELDDEETDSPPPKRFGDVFRSSDTAKKKGIAAIDGKMVKNKGPLIRNPVNVIGKRA